MKEQRDIVRRWREGEGETLVSLARVQGSSYRRPGAKLLICGDGTYEGSISAGCLEGELLRKASWLTRRGAALHTFSTLYDDASEMPFGLGCGGVMEVLLEPVASDECQALLHALERALNGIEQTVATWLPRGERPLMRAVFGPDGDLLFASTGIAAETLRTLQAMRHRDASEDLADDLLLERIYPPQRLFVFGAGDDAKPLTQMAVALGWSVTVADGRPQLARPDRFASGQVRVLASVREAAGDVRAGDAVVVMTHSFEQDRECLSVILPRRPRYLGLLGARHRSALLIAQVAKASGLSLQACCEQITAPVGLDIGGEGPESIALAVMAEVHLVCAGKKNDLRRLSTEFVESHLAHIVPDAREELQCSLNMA